MNSLLPRGKVDGVTRLLVSVRSPEEASLALEAGVHLIDVKEPRHGSLGAASPRVWREVADCVAGLAPLSLALGELREFHPPQSASVPPQYGYAKLGLAGCAQHAWQDRLLEAWQSLPPAVQPVAVIYADWQRAAAPPPQDVLAVAAASGCRAILLDTAEKDGSTLLAHCPLEELARLVETARGLAAMVVLGGSLSAVEIAAVLPLAPDYIAVRGAACAGGRSGRLDPQRIQELLARLPQPARR
jgi:hypothetical protein